MIGDRSLRGGRRREVRRSRYDYFGDEGGGGYLNLLQSWYSFSKPGLRRLIPPPSRHTVNE